VGVSVGIIADDLSGAAAMAAEFRRASMSTIVVDLCKARQPRLSEPDVVVVNTRTRYAGPEAATAACAAATKAFTGDSLQVVVKKIDSMLRGPIGAEFEGLFEALPLDKCLLVAAAPGLGRTTVDGTQYSGDRPIGDLMRREDPTCSVPPSHIPTLLAAQSRCSIDVMSLAAVRRGSDAVKQAALTSSAQILVADCTSERELEDVVAGAWAAGIRLFAGTYGLGRAIVPHLSQRVDRGGVLVVAGSMSATTRKQVEHLLGARDVVHVPLHSGALLSARDATPTLDAVRALVSEALTTRQIVVLTTAHDAEDQAVLRQHAERSGWSERQTSGEVEGLVRQVLKPIIRLASAIVATGGSTAELIVDVADPAELEVLDEELLPGSPVTLMRGGAVDGLRFVTKPGSFGAEDALHRMAVHLQQPGVRPGHQGELK